MKMMKRVISASVVALIISILFYSVVLATVNYVSEQSSNFTGYHLSAATGCSSTTCKDSNAKYGNQGSSASWGQWNTLTDNVTKWQTFIPNLTGDWAAVKYSISNSVSEFYQTTVNQNNWKGSYVNLGTFSYNSTSSEAFGPNTCVSGFACDGRKLYFDKSQYTY